LFWPENESKIYILVSFQHMLRLEIAATIGAQSFHLQMCIFAKSKQRTATQSSLIRRSRTQRVQQIVITISNVSRGVAGTPADDAAADLPAGRAESEAAPSANERAGRGLGWNTAELLALCSSGLTVDRDSVRGAGMKKAERARSLLAEFKRSPKIPESVIAIVRSADNGDSDASRRWLGRTAAACLSEWEKVTSQCSEIHKIMTRVKAKPWTGFPEDEDFVHAVTAIRNRSCEVSNLYSVLRSASYPVGKTFPFVDAYHFFVEQNYFVAKPQQIFPSTIRNAPRCVQYNERVGQR
jgi:hypothetical protein